MHQWQSFMLPHGMFHWNLKAFFSAFNVINLTWKYLCAFNLTLEWETLKGIPLAFICSYKCQRQQNINMRRLNCFMRRETGKFGERYFSTAAVQWMQKNSEKEKNQLDVKGFFYLFELSQPPTLNCFRILESNKIPKFRAQLYPVMYMINQCSFLSSRNIDATTKICPRDQKKRKFLNLFFTLHRKLFHFFPLNVDSKVLLRNEGEVV